MTINQEKNTRVSITLNKEVKRALEVISYFDDKTISQCVIEMILPEVKKKIEERKEERLTLWARALIADPKIKDMLVKEFENPERYDDKECADMFKNFSEDRKEYELEKYVKKNMKDTLINAYDIDKIFELEL